VLAFVSYLSYWQTGTLEPTGALLDSAMGKNESRHDWGSKFKVSENAAALLETAVTDPEEEATATKKNVNQRMKDLGSEFKVSEHAAALLEMAFTDPEEEATAIKNVIRWNTAKIRSMSAKDREYQRMQDFNPSVVDEIYTLLTDKLVLLKENKALLVLYSTQPIGLELGARWAHILTVLKTA
jgi:hypothetical protein